MNEQGFPSLGYSYANFDDCIVTGRDPVSHKLIPDALAFPRGPLAVSQDLATLGWRMGWYTVRGATTCASGPPPRLERPGSAGFELLDAESYASWGVQYLKVRPGRGLEVSAVLRCPLPSVSSFSLTRAPYAGRLVWPSQHAVQCHGRSSEQDFAAHILHALCPRPGASHCADRACNRKRLVRGVQLGVCGAVRCANPALLTICSPHFFAGG